MPNCTFIWWDIRILYILDSHSLTLISYEICEQLATDISVIWIHNIRPLWCCLRYACDALEFARKKEEEQEEEEEEKKTLI